MTLDILRIHHFMPENSPVNASIVVPWMRKLEAEAGGRLRCEVYPEMRLGGSPEQLYDQVVSGAVDIVWTMPSYSAGKFHSIEVFELPFMMRGRTATSMAAWEYAKQWSAAELADVHPLSIHVIGSGGFHMRDRPIRTRKDIVDLNLRVPNVQTELLVSELGGRPHHISPLRTRDALANGEVDGVLMNWDFANSTRSIEVTRFHSDTSASRAGLFTSAIIFVMNKDRYRSLSDAVRQVIDRNSGAALAGWIGRTFEAFDGTGHLPALKQGNFLNIIETEELDRWADTAGRVVVDRWVAEENIRGRNGMQLVESAKKLIAHYASYGCTQGL